MPSFAAMRDNPDRPDHPPTHRKRPISEADLAAALRENLRKRKAQAQARKGDADKAMSSPQEQPEKPQ